jgi:PAS domain S-box-containing protein
LLVERPRLGIVLTLTVALVAMVALAVGTITWLDVRRERAIFVDESENRALALVAAVKDVLNDPLYFRDVDAVDDIATDLADEAGVEYVHVYAANGELLADSEKGDYPAGYGVSGMKNFSSGVTIGRFEVGVLQVDTSIEVAGQVIGGLTMGFNTAQVDENIVSLTRTRIWLAMGLVGGATILSYLLASLLTWPLTRANAELRAEVGERHRAETALLESRERFSLLFKHNPVAMALVSLDGQYLAVNGRLAEMLGRAPEDMVDLSVFDVTNPEYGHSALDMPQNPRDVSYMETRCVTGDGGSIWVGVNTAIASDPDGEPAFAIMTVQDVSGRKREQALEKRYLTALELHASEIRERYEEAERLRRSLEDENSHRRRFLSVLSHELRTPLTPILSSSQMLEELLRPDPRSGEGRLI